MTPEVAAALLANEKELTRKINAVMNEARLKVAPWRLTRTQGRISMRGLSIEYRKHSGSEHQKATSADDFGDDAED